MLFRTSSHSCFIHVSVTTPIVSALKKLLYIGLSGIQTDFLNPFWIEVTVSILKPPHGDFRNDVTVSRAKRFKMYNGYRLYVTAIPERTQVPVRV